MPSMNKNDLQSAHKLCTKHRNFIRDNTRCGCFYCGSIITGREIEKWIDGGKTAMCPRCGIDSLIPENCGYDLTEEFLTQMKEYWFGIKPE